MTLSKLVCLNSLACFVLALTGCGQRIPYRIEPAYAVDDPQFIRTMGNLMGPSLVEGNSVTTLLNGDQIFPAMLDAIDSARHTITFETFVYWRGSVGRDFTEALSAKARSGVRVHVIIDAVGADRIDRDYIRQMRDAGVQVELYHPLRWYQITEAYRLNYRTHRKILVVDGRVAFTGGVGIADEWRGDADTPNHYRDTHYRIEGPVVAQLQAAFVDNWIETTGRVLHEEHYFPALEGTGSRAAQVFKSSAEGGSESMQLGYLLSFAAARHNIRLGSAYFVPDDLTIQYLLDARRRGVRVQIIIPGSKIDVKIVRPASRAKWGPLLQAGVEIYEYQPTMYHCKLMVVDGRWVSIGSANLDSRSFRLNDEANLNVMDSEFAAEQIRIFEEDLKKCRQITYEEWKRRPWHKRITEAGASLLAPQL